MPAKRRLKRTKKLGAKTSYKFIVGGLLFFLAIAGLIIIVKKIRNDDPEPSTSAETETNAETVILPAEPNEEPDNQTNDGNVEPANPDKPQTEEESNTDQCLENNQCEDENPQPINEAQEEAGEDSQPIDEIQEEDAEDVEDQTDSPAIDYLIFNGNQFNQLFDEAKLQNLNTVSDPPYITGDPQTDARIRQIAIERGYRQRPMPADISRLVLAEGDRHYLQPEAAQAYLDLKNAAEAEGMIIWLVSAYRSYDYQRPLFLRDLTPAYTDDEIFEQLKLVAIPGYSKHHTGYTVDLAEGQHTFAAFAGTISYRWLSANNYENAKRHGWIPSYPPDAEKQGPDPEPWEFVYVGRKYLEANSP